jgi:ketosteroid isomerase-like protein
MERGVANPEDGGLIFGAGRKRIEPDTLIQLDGTPRPMTETETRNRRIVETICQAFNDHDPDGIVDHFADDSVWLLSRGTPPDGATLRGKAEIREMIVQRFASIHDIAWEIHNHWAGGDRACSEWTVTGTEANGNRLEWLGCDLWLLNEDGQVLRKDTYWKYAGGES